MAKTKQKEEAYRLLGIDPGTNVLGYAAIEVNGKELKLLELGVVQLSKLNSHAEKLQHILERMTSIIEVHKPRHTAIEAPFYGKNVQSMLKLGRAQGVAIAASMTKGVEVTEYSPRKIKQAVTGKGNASKEQVAALLEMEFQIDLSAYMLDATDALAAVCCHYYQSRLGIDISKQKDKSVHQSLNKGNRRNKWADFVAKNPNRAKK